MKRVKQILTCFLCAALIFAGIMPAFGARYEVKDEIDRRAFTDLFNNSVNRIKWDRPFGLVTYTNGVPKKGITVGDALNGDELDSSAERFLVPVLEGMFNNNTNLTQSFIKAIFKQKVDPETKRLLTRGASCNDLVPLYGMNEVSRLNSEKKDYSMWVDQDDDAQYPNGIAVTFPETKLEDAWNASVSDVFSLPDGTIDPVIVGTRERAGNDLLIQARLQNLRFANATAAAQFDRNGDLVYYGNFVDYKFDFSFYDAMNIVAAFVGMNLYTAILNTINTVYANMGKDAVDAETVMKERMLHVTYRCTVEVSNLSWNIRYFGDCDGDGEISAADARAALRHSVALDLLTNAADQIYTDVDFDGEITAADARMILRMSVGLEAPMTMVPNGETIKIALEDAPDPPTQNPNDPDQKTGWFSDIKIDTTPADIAQSIFDVIGLIRDTEEQFRDIKDDLKDIANQ